MTEFLPKLRQSLEQLCDTYIDVLLDKDGVHSAIDRIDEKITFIIARTDDLPGLSWTPSEKSDDEPSKTASRESRIDVAEDDMDVKDDDSLDKADVEKRELVAEIEKQKCESICKAS